MGKGHTQEPHSLLYLRSGVSVEGFRMVSVHVKVLRKEAFVQSFSFT